MSDAKLREDDVTMVDPSPKPLKKAADQLGPAINPGRQAERAAVDPARQSRGQTDRNVTEVRILTEEERLDMFRQKFSQDALPDLPPIPGFHICWLTTTNPRDSIASRVRLGYEPVTEDDVPGFKYATIKTGEYAGLIGVNEMVAFKLPLRLYERYMREAHHDAPMREQEKLTANVDSLRDEARAKGAELLEGDGYRDLRAPAPAAPIFSTEDERRGALN